MTTRIACGALVGVSMLASAATAAVTVTNSQLLWNYRLNTSGQTVAAESFNSLADGFIAGPLTGTLGNTFWTATAEGGLFAQSGMLSTATAFKTLNFTFAPGVRGVAGNIFGTDIGFNVVPTIVNVSLSDGTAFESFTDSASDFIGFTSTTANISSLSITVLELGTSGNVWSTINNLYVAVPAPGAAALIGLAGLATRRRRA